MNPKVKQFLADNEDITLVSFGWSIFWRLYLVILGICVALGFLIGLMEL